MDSLRKTNHLYKINIFIRKSYWKKLWLQLFVQRNGTVQPNKHHKNVVHYIAPTPFYSLLSFGIPMGACQRNSGIFLPDAFLANLKFVRNFRNQDVQKMAMRDPT